MDEYIRYYLWAAPWDCSHEAVLDSFSLILSYHNGGVGIYGQSCAEDGACEKVARMTSDYINKEYGGSHLRGR